MSECRVWVLPGMGADSRIFKSFKFPWNATYLEWIEPKTEESLSEYADRLLGAYPIKENDLIFGYSFGGIVAQDWASRNKVQRVVLLNSFCTTNEKLSPSAILTTSMIVGSKLT